MENNITAVLGIYMETPEQLKRTIDFVEDLNQRFPKIPMSLSCVGSHQEYQDELKRLYGEKIITGTTRRVSFSETWNEAIKGVKTEKFVFLHNDMYLAPDFFTELDKYLQDPKKFHVYTTVEPLKNQGFPRPGKLVAAFGEDTEDFKKDEFLKFAAQYRDSHQREGRGYSFYIAGFTESIRDVGGFDFTTFDPIFCEDDDLMVRIRKHGYLLCTAPSAILYHFGSKTTREIGATQMSASEVEMNRRFARKWGFEARFLWDTGYEFEDEPLNTGAEIIGYKIEYPQTTVHEILNVEPLVDIVDCQDQGFLDYLQPLGLPEKAANTDSCDIVITQVGPGNFNAFCSLAGTLRFKHQTLKPGTTRVGSYLVEIRRVRPEVNRLDSRNYLSLQK